MRYVAAPAPRVAVYGRNDAGGLFGFDDAREGFRIAKPRGLHIELVDSVVEKRVELSFGFAARFSDLRVHLWHLTRAFTCGRASAREPGRRVQCVVIPHKRFCISAR